MSMFISPFRFPKTVLLASLALFAGGVQTQAQNFADNPQPAAAQPQATPAAVQLMNLSTRLIVRTGPQVGIAGFELEQTSPQPLAISPPQPTPGKQILVRALGPSLTSRGVISPTLQNPALQLYNSSGTLIAMNDNWRDTQEQAIRDSGVAPMNDLEAALIATLPAGQYTAVVSGATGGSGVALVEVYDLDGSSDLPLVNLSTRGEVETGESAVIAGVISQGEGSAQFLLRGIGPELTSRGVANVLLDPTLVLFDANGNALASNDNWKDSQQTQIAATGIAPTDDRESAILVSLPAGAYTALLRGNNTAGIGLIEVYNLTVPSGS